jgi:hypothetical protein
MFASFMNPSIPLPPPTGGGPKAAVGGAASQATSDSLANFLLQYQQFSNWCWAAVSASVSGYFSPPGTNQCSIASAELGKTCCGPTNPACNVPWYLDRALSRVGHYRSIVNSSVPFGQVRTEISAPVSSPVCCRIEWVLGGAHFVSATGYRVAGDGTEYLDINDPFFGPTTISFSAFKSSYRSQGDSWTHTYLTALNGTVVAGSAPSSNTPKSA